jgi:2-dehydro-3-deoxyphosphogluconate aldolase/(4S)-4-hydroxy-2-oxoglutarate aldolase
MSAATAIAAVERERLIAIVRLRAPEEARAVVEELLGGGVRVIEFSLAAGDALAALAEVVAEFGGLAEFGAGTVLSPAEATAAAAAGASFLVSPNLDPAVVERARELDLLHLPGAFTPTEVKAAMGPEASLVKLFPAGRLGPGYLRDLLAPYPDARLVPTGGVDLDNAADFLAAGAAAIAVGGALVDPAAPTAAGLADRARMFFDLVAASKRGDQSQ